MTVTPGIAAALRRKSVSSRPARAPDVWLKRTLAVTPSGASAMIWANSAMLARVQGQCGCASINSVGLFGCRGTIEAEGQSGATDVEGPGVVSYLQRTCIP